MVFIDNVDLPISNEKTKRLCGLNEMTRIIDVGDWRDAAVACSVASIYISVE